MKPLLRAMLLAVLNQGVTSGTNFVLGALLVRTLSTEGFGTYGLGFSALLLALNAGEALFMTPGTVLIAQAPPERAPAVARAVFTCAVAISSGIALLSGLACALMLRSGSAQSIFGVSAATTVAAFFFVLKEELVRICYALRREGGALVLNLVFGVLAAGLVVAPATRAETPTVAILYYAAGAGAAWVVAVAVLRPFRGGAAMPMPAHEVMRVVIGQGRWYLGSNLAYWLRIQAPLLTATWTLGLGAVGVLNAGRLLVTPAVLMNPAMGQIALPRLARIAKLDDGAARVARGATAVGMLLLAVSTTYCAILWFGLDGITKLLLGSRSRVPETVVAAWCAFVLALAVRNGFEIALKATAQPRRILTANTVSVAAALPLCLIGGAWFGQPGIVAGAAVSELAVIGVMIALSRAGRSAPSPATPSLDGSGS